MPSSGLKLEDPLNPLLTPLEQAVIDLLLAGEHPILVALRKQIENAVITSREYSGAGFFTNFALPADFPPLPLPFKNFELGHVKIKIPGPKYGAGVLLFVRDGFIDWLEGFTYGPEPWPEDTSIFEVENWEQEKKKLMDYLEGKTKE